MIGFSDAKWLLIFCRVFKRAARINAQRLILVGSSEWQRGMVGVKNLSSGEQCEVKLDELNWTSFFFFSLSFSCCAVVLIRLDFISFHFTFTDFPISELGPMTWHMLEYSIYPCKIYWLFFSFPCFSENFHSLSLF